jgi:hypothetical protein
MKKTNFYFIALLSIANISLSNTFQSYNQKTRTLKIKEKIQDEQSKMKMSAVVTFAGLGLFFLGTRNQTKEASNAQLFAHLTGVVLTGVGSLLGIQSLQKYVLLNHKSKTPETQTNESAKTSIGTVTK